MNTNITPRTVWTNPVHFLAFGFGSGTLPVAPGTWGTLVAIPIFLVLSQFSIFIYSGFLIFSLLIGIWLCHVTAHDLGVHDHCGIVWDEIVGFLITMIMIPPTWYWILLGFILFRIFDIIKPWPIRLLDQKVKGGFGIMIDDVLAGIYATVILNVFLFFMF